MAFSNFPARHQQSYTLTPIQMGAGQMGADMAPLPSDLPRDVSSKFGLKLRDMRLQRNLTQLRMATDFGIDRSFISDLERGRKSVSLPMLEVLALGLEVTLSELLQGL